MSKSITAVLFCLSLVPAMLTGGPPSRTKPAESLRDKAQLEQLIEQLGSPEFREREAASKALAECGVEVLPALQKASNHADPEVRRRVADLLPGAEKAVALAPTRVSLNLTRRPIREAVAEIARQTGYPIKVEQPEQQDRRRHSFHFKGLTFWEAMEKVCAAGEFRYHKLPSGKGTIVLSWLAGCKPFPCSLNGPFKVEVYGVEGTTDPVDHLHVSSFLSVEPKLGLLSVHYSAWQEVRDDQKGDLLSDLMRYPDADVFRSAYGWGNPTAHHPAGGWIKRPGKQAKVVKSLKGSIPVLLLTQRKPALVIDNILTVRGKTLEAGDIALTVAEVIQLGPADTPYYQVKLSIREGKEEHVGETDFSWVGSLPYRFELQDARGNTYQTSTDPSWTKRTRTSASGTVQFSRPEEGQVLGPAVKLVFSTWVTMPHRVPFEFTNLPLR